MTLTKRRKMILKRVVEKYIKMAKPISSAMLTRKDFPKLSSATLRNEMLSLTNQGLLYQPYTSAGRIPTLQGFKFFLDHFLKKESAALVSKKKIFLAIDSQYRDERKKIKEIVKKLAEFSQSAAMIAFSKDDFYYTGLTYLFHQPEFKNFSLICSFSKVIDHLDETMRQIFDKIKKTEILIGENNPFGNQYATIFDQSKIKGKKIIIGLLGPRRMDYNRNLSLIKYVTKMIEE